MLSDRYPQASLAGLLMPRDQWAPYPQFEDRRAWEGLPANVRGAYVDLGSEMAAGEWPLLLATQYLDYRRNGNRSRHAAGYFARRSMLASLVIAECIEGKGRFLDEIVNGIWLICEESSWCIPAHVGVQRAGTDLADTTEPIVDLFAAETGAYLAWTDYLLGARLNQVSPLVRPRILREVDARILCPCMARDDFWWMGFGTRRVNNWNPWINSNWLASVLLLESDQAARATAVAKILRSLDRFLDPYPADGGCDEGPNYWGRAGASLLDCLELLHSASQGEIDVYDQPLIQEIGRYIYRVQIAGRWFVNFADADALVVPTALATLRYGQRIADEKLMALGAWAAEEEDARCARASVQLRRKRLPDLNRILRTLFSLGDLDSVAPLPPLPRESWLCGIQVLVARDREGSTEGLFVAAKGGHNAESHNHNDVGQFIVSVDGCPVLADAGVETYTAKTFGPHRYDIWTMQSAHHNLPTIDGAMQQPGLDHAARDVTYDLEPDGPRLTLDIGGAYGPDAKIRTWHRSVKLQRGVAVVVTDRYELGRPAGEITMSLLTPCQVDLSVPGQIALTEAALPDGRASGEGMIYYDGAQFAVSQKRIPIDDERMSPVWGDGLNLITLRAVSPPRKGAFEMRVTPMP